MILRHAMFFLFSCSVLASCARVPDLQSRLASARQEAGPTFQEVILKTDQFDLYAQFRNSRDGNLLTAFIEGDGYAWASRRRASGDPTPITQMVLSLAQGRSPGNVAYLARPCQFVGPESRNCRVAFWTNARYGEAVVSSLDQALTLLQAKTDTTDLRLIGYSGGGALAALLAARRTDVRSIITLAAPLDTTAFTQYHHVTPLDGSLNPKDYASKLTLIPQVHFVGAMDEIVPQQISLSFVDAFSSTDCVDVRVVASADHWTGWQNIQPPVGEVFPKCAQGTQ